jgi:hypothetical protein
LFRKEIAQLFDIQLAIADLELQEKPITLTFADQIVTARECGLLSELATESASSTLATRQADLPLVS